MRTIIRDFKDNEKCEILDSWEKSTTLFKINRSNKAFQRLIPYLAASTVNIAFL